MNLDVLRRRYWPAQRVSLLMWDTHRRDDRGQTFIGYRLRWKGKVLFQGEDFAGSPLHADDSDETVRALMSFLTLRPGDTDCEYFANYSELQNDWTNSSECDELACELACEEEAR